MYAAHPSPRYTCACTNFRQLTVNQFATFVGRFSFWLFRLPGGKTRSTDAYWALCALEGLIFFVQAGNSSRMMASPATNPDNPELGVMYGPLGVIALAGMQGLMAGIVFCNTYWKVMNKPLPPAVYEALDAARAAEGLKDRAYRGSMETVAEAIGLLDGPPVSGAGAAAGERRQSPTEETALREFLLSTIAPPDVISVTFASLVGMVIQRGLCYWQVSNERYLCIQ